MRTATLHVVAALAAMLAIAGAAGAEEPASDARPAEFGWATRSMLPEPLSQPELWDRPVRLSLVREAAAPAARAEAKDWQIIVAPYIWAAGMKGDVTVRGRSGSVDASFIDVLEKSDSIVGLQGHMEIWKGRLGVFVDGTYLKLDVDDALSGRLEASLTNELAIIEFGAMYRVGQWDLPGKRDAGAYVPSLAFDAIAGGRYTHLGAELDFARGPSVDGTQDWVDPLIGGRIVYNMTRELQLVVRGDIGGFGVGSNFAWSATGLLGYKFKCFGADATAYLGYRALDQDFEDGSGRDKFEFDVLMHGPITGIAFRF